MSESQSSRMATWAYIAPFIAFVGIMAIEKALSIPPQIAYPIRFCTVWALVLALSRPYLNFRFSAPLASIAIGAAVFVIWVGPDLLSPHYRQSWLFNNPVVGTAVSSISPELRQATWFILIRMLSCTLLVPIVEELFWRGWLMRWMIDRDFWNVPLGKYDATAFWVTAVLFASEHGPYWEVGLITGVIYNWWMVRTKNLADCILMHAVTNGILSVYVVLSGRWEYLF
jgi:CAAX prenyl protease-like protein